MVFDPNQFVSEYLGKKSTTTKSDSAFDATSFVNEYLGKKSATTPQTDTFAEWTGIQNKNTYFKDSWNQLVETIKHPIKAIGGALSAGLQTIPDTFKHAGADIGEAFKTEGDNWSKNTADVMNALGASASVLFLPMTAVFSAAEKLPVLKQGADVVNSVFTTAGKLVAFPAGKFVDVLPIDQADKDVLKPAFEEIGTLAGQIILGGKVMGKLSKGVKKLGKEEVVKLKNEAIAESKIAEQTVVKNNPELKQTTPKQEVVKPVVESPLAQEATKYKSAEEFVKKNNPVNAVVFRDYDSNYVEFGPKMVSVNLSANDLVKGKGITREYMLNALKDASNDGAKRIIPSLGSWTKEGKGFMDTLVRDGWVTKTKDGTYFTTEKIKTWETKSQLTDIYNQAVKGKIQNFQEWMSSFKEMPYGKNAEDGYAYYLEGKLGKTPTIDEVKKYGEINKLTDENAYSKLQDARAKILQENPIKGGYKITADQKARLKALEVDQAVKTAPEVKAEFIDKFNKTYNTGEAKVKTKTALDLRNESILAENNYRDWIKQQPEAQKAIKDIQEKYNTIPISRTKDRADFLKQEKQKLDTKFSKIYAETLKKPTPTTPISESKIAEGVKILEQDPTFEKGNHKEYTRVFLETLAKDPELALDIALGKKEAPKGGTQASFAKLMGNAEFNPNLTVEQIMRLTEKPVVASKAGQELESAKLGAGELGIVDAVKEINKIRKESLGKVNMKDRVISIIKKFEC